MPKKYRFNQAAANVGIISDTPLSISEFRVRLDDGTKVSVMPPNGKPFFDDGDLIDVEKIGPPEKTKRFERSLAKDPRFTKS